VARGRCFRRLSRLGRPQGFILSSSDAQKLPITRLLCRTFGYPSPSPKSRHRLHYFRECDFDTDKILRFSGLLEYLLSQPSAFDSTAMFGKLPNGPEMSGTDILQTTRQPYYQPFASASHGYLSLCATTVCLRASQRAAMARCDWTMTVK
jgi:hypothetical protein